MAIIIYYITIDSVYDNQIHKWQQLISQEKRLRARRFHFWDDVKRCVVGEMLIRYALYETYRINPQEIEFELLEYGKPVIVGAGECQFSLSHSGKWVVCAVGSCLVGVDIEKKEEKHLKIAESVFTQYENKRIQMLPDMESKVNEFYKLWTMKESYMKITGLGFQKGMNTFEFHLEGEDEFLYEKEMGEKSDYKFYSEIFDEHYVMSLCYESLETFIEKKELCGENINKMIDMFWEVR